MVGSNQNNRRGNPDKSGGKPPMRRRDAERLNNFNAAKAEATNSWANMEDVHDRYVEATASSNQKERNRTQFEKRKQRKPAAGSGKPETATKAQVDPKSFDRRAEAVETPAKDEPMWDEGQYGGTHPVQQLYSHNVDFSSFVLVIEVAYNNMELENPRLQREMPFPLFQHCMFEYANLAMIKMAKEENVDQEYMMHGPPDLVLPENIVIPKIIKDYIESIATVITPQGDEIRVNYPLAGRPRAQDGEIHAGYFGNCDADNHNAYECYPSPAVSMQLVQRTVEANRNPQAAGAFEDWNPLPAALAPNRGVATQNLLGYRTPPRLPPEGIAKCENLVFANGDSLAGRICDCPQITLLVSGVLSKMKKTAMSTGLPKPRPNSAAIGFVEAANDVPPANRLVNAACTVNSPQALGSNGVNHCGTFGLKRHRTNNAMGPAYLTPQGQNIVGWQGTINSNFAMVGNFAPVVGQDRPALRIADHTAASPAGDRRMIIDGLFKRAYTINE